MQCKIAMKKCNSKTHCKTGGVNEPLIDLEWAGPCDYFSIDSSLI